MRAIIQRVSGASVTIENVKISSIKTGLMILLGIEQEDSEEDAQWLVRKICSLRIFGDENGNMNHSLQDIKGEVLLVSQFTLHAKIKKGNRPSFIKAASPEIANKLYEITKQLFNTELNQNIAAGKFGAMMQVQLINDGPITLIIDTKNKE
ncbi:MAG: D-aminoacyl-tRNA deacylase [Salibacteraceae bacterium]|nr:D-aminoacyl-tRNA deacylase [Salibacteraceae bacterium]|tara:strand:+ start:12304 stop:12756 length:453 start_codon:yes stop_codon:yes gene_type:complete